MIESIKISNFRSIREEQELYFTVYPENTLSTGKHNINVVSCLIGSNESGKTNILKALAFMNDLTEWNTEDFYPCLKSNTRMKIVLLDDDKTYTRNLDKPFKCNYQKTCIHNFDYQNLHDLGENLDQIALNIRAMIQPNTALQEKCLRFLQSIDIHIDQFDFEIDRYLYTVRNLGQKDPLKLSILQEGAGTIRILHVLLAALQTLDEGGVMIWDNIETSIHLLAARKLINLFENPETNPNYAQLIFSTHQALLLNDRTKTQIFITENNRKTLQTEIFRLDTMVDHDDSSSLGARYLAGGYGGIPHIKWFAHQTFR
jgi:AAA15 family ATPase/GTPase